MKINMKTAAAALAIAFGIAALHGIPVNSSASLATPAFAAPTINPTPAPTQEACDLSRGCRYLKGRGCVCP